MVDGLLVQSFYSRRVRTKVGTKKAYNFKALTAEGNRHGSYIVNSTAICATIVSLNTTTVTFRNLMPPPQFSAELTFMQEQAFSFLTGTP